MEISKEAIIKEKSFEIRSGKALTTIYLVNSNGIPTQSLVFKTQEEIPKITEKLNEIVNFWKNENELAKS